MAVVHAYMNHVQQAANDAVQAMLLKIADRHALRRHLPKSDRFVQVDASDYMDCGAEIRLKLTIDRQLQTAVFDFNGTGEREKVNWI